MVESQGDYLDRKMMKIQEMIKEAKLAGALGMPAVLDGFNSIAGGAFIEIKIIINEPKLEAYRKIKEGGR